LCVAGYAVIVRTPVSLGPAMLIDMARMRTTRKFWNILDLVSCPQIISIRPVA